MKLSTYLKNIMVLATIAMLCIFGFPSLASQVSGQEESFNLLQWLGDNWELVALVLSELCAYLPAKYKGLIQGAITLIGKVLTWIASKSKD